MEETYEDVDNSEKEILNTMETIIDKIDDDKIDDDKIDDINYIMLDKKDAIVTKKENEIISSNISIENDPDNLNAFTDDTVNELMSNYENEEKHENNFIPTNVSHKTFSISDMMDVNNMINNKEYLKNNEKLYNYSHNITYHIKDINDPKIDTYYREDMITCFNMAMPMALGVNVQDALKIINKSMEALYFVYKDYEQVESILETLKDNSPFPFEMKIEDLFMCLFSFDFLHLFHNCLVDLHDIDEISEYNFNNLIEKIKEK